MLCNSVLKDEVEDILCKEKKIGKKKQLLCCEVAPEVPSSQHGFQSVLMLL